jgi:hypothetical protein
MRPIGSWKRKETLPARASAEKPPPLTIASGSLLATGHGRTVPVRTARGARGIAVPFGPCAFQYGPWTRPALMLYEFDL